MKNLMRLKMKDPTTLPREPQCMAIFHLKKRSQSFEVCNIVDKCYLRSVNFRFHQNVIFTSLTCSSGVDILKTSLRPLFDFYQI